MCRHYTGRRRKLRRNNTNVRRRIVDYGELELQNMEVCKASLETVCFSMSHLPIRDLTFNCELEDHAIPPLIVQVEAE
jgi:hypothetical protein